MSKTMELSKVKAGDLFKIGEIEFIKFGEENGVVTAVTKDIVFDSIFGENNNFKESEVLKRLENEFLPKIAEVIGMDNICDFITDLTTLDGLKVYGEMTSKVSLPTFDFYRQNVSIFDKYNPGKWWWTATADSAKPHCNPYWIKSVSPDGGINDRYYGSDYGVRPFLRFVSSISVSCEE